MKNIRKKVRFHFNLKSKHLLVIMTLFCGSCIVATAASGTTSAPLQNVAGFLVVPFEKGISGVSNNLDQEYTDYPKVAARIISKDPGNWYDTFMINKGTNDGIHVDNNVIAGKGLVGIVTEVGPSWLPFVPLLMIAVMSVPWLSALLIIALLPEIWS